MYRLPARIYCVPEKTPTNFCPQPGMVGHVDEPGKAPRDPFVVVEQAKKWPHELMVIFPRFKLIPRIAPYESTFSLLGGDPLCEYEFGDDRLTEPAFHVSKDEKNVEELYAATFRRRLDYDDSKLYVGFKLLPTNLNNKACVCFPVTLAYTPLLPILPVAIENPSE